MLVARVLHGAERAKDGLAPEGLIAAPSALGNRLGDVGWRSP